MSIGGTEVEQHGGWITVNLELVSAEVGKSIRRLVRHILGEGVKGPMGLGGHLVMVMPNAIKI